MDEPLAHVVSDLRSGDSATGERRRSIPAALGYLFAAGCLVWVLRDFDSRSLVAAIRGARPGWIAVAILCDVASYVVQGARWRLLLAPLGRLSTLRATRAIYTGLFTNELLPMKLGEIVRAGVVARELETGVADIAPSILAERVIDGLWLVGAVALVGWRVALPPIAREAAGTLAIAVLAGVVVIALLVRLARRLAPSGSRSHAADADSTLRALVAQASALVARLADGFRRIGLTRNTIAALALSGLFLLLQAVAFVLVAVACHVDVSLPAGVAVFVLVHLGVALPSAPANVGSFQFFTVLGLTLFGVARADAVAFSIVVFVVLTVPLWLLGSIAIARAGLTLGSLRSALGRGRA
jgi:uncharacterized protein (TIRG00374 family)